jgi:hypothetical protein
MKFDNNIEIKGSMAFKHTNSGKCKEEVLNRSEQIGKASARTLNSLLWSKHFILNTKKRIFYTVVGSI